MPRVSGLIPGCVGGGGGTNGSGEPSVKALSCAPARCAAGRGGYTSIRSSLRRLLPPPRSRLDCELDCSRRCAAPPTLRTRPPQSP